MIISFSCIIIKSSSQVSSSESKWVVLRQLMVLYCGYTLVNTINWLTLTLKTTTAQVVKTSVTVKNNSPIQDYVRPYDQTQPTCVSRLLDKRNKEINEHWRSKFQIAYRLFKGKGKI